MTAAVPARRVWPWLLVVAVIAAAGFALHSPWLSVHEIEITGAVRSNPALGVAAAGVGDGAILVWVDTGAVEAAVRADPWVADARVTRVWPDRLVVEVIERIPLLWIEGPMEWMLVARDGTVVDTAPVAVPGLMHVAVPFGDIAPGVRPDDPEWGEFVGFALVMIDGPALTIRFRGSELWTELDGHPVRLGSAIDLADKGRTLRALLASGVPDGATVDVSSPLRPTVIPADG